MNPEDILSGQAGLAGIQWALNGPVSRRALKREAQEMLRPGFRAGTFHLTRAKFKPGRKLSAYFTFPALDTAGKTSHPVQLAVAWKKDIDGSKQVDGWAQLQDEANQAGLMPVHSALWRELLDQGIELRVWPFDPKFPQLVRLGNPSFASGLFDSLGIARELKQVPVITPIRYRPGERHVLRYEFDSPEAGTGARQRVYAKLYSNAEDAARAFGIANRVVDWLDSNPVGLQGNRPEAISQEDGVIFYPHAPGVPLSHQLHRSRKWLGAQFQTVGRGLAVLHSGPESLQAGLKQNDFSKEAKVVRRAGEHIHVLLPETYNKIVEIVETAQEGYARLPQEGPTFTHADFKSDHLLSTPQGLTLIDFDTCTLTDPALDIGKFLADLEWWFTLEGVSGVEEAQAQLLKGYVGEGASDLEIQERLRRARFFHTLILVKIVVRRVPLYKKEWADITSQMIERAAQVLDQAMET